MFSIPNLIKICDGNHRRQTPLIRTLSFPGMEWWCPYCGRVGTIVTAGIGVPVTTKLANRARDDEKKSRSYLRAKGRCHAAFTRFKGELVRPQDLPNYVKIRDRNIIDRWERGRGLLK